uniref:Kinesin-like protein n=2 Tax=Alexandrium monilatum TaxID=311494 RepID=A0A7S4S7I3_9DINO
MVHMFMNHHDFVFDEAFDENTGNAAVYTGTASGLVERALEGGHGTVMMYGQTGSGKTFTMTAIYELVAEDLFAGLDDRTVSVCFIELSGDSCFDMLNQGSSCNLATAPDGAVHPFPSVEVEVHDVSELLALIEMATKLRATAATGVHDQSSRSHALCRIFVGPPPGSGIADFEGSLTLVDLAGSEHRIDNAEHNAERRKEGAKINQSLWALKECVRAMAAGSKAAFRQHKLTQLLHGCFESRKRHPTVVIATVSPCSKDTEHTLNTLRHACIMDGQGEGKSEGSEHLAGGAVTREKLGEIDVTRIARERRAERKQAQAEGLEPPAEGPGPSPAAPPLDVRAAGEAAGARGASDRRCVKGLPQGLRQALLEARAVTGGNERQRRRLGRAAGPGTAAATGDAAACPRGRGSRAVSCPPAAMPSQPASGRGRSSGRGSVSRGGVSGRPSSDLERAVELFSILCREGPAGREWQAEELRLVSMHIVPVLFGLDARIDWQRPDTALGELQRLMDTSPPPAHFLRLPEPHEDEDPMLPPPRSRAGDRTPPPSSQRRPRGSGAEPPTWAVPAGGSAVRSRSPGVASRPPLVPACAPSVPLPPLAPSSAPPAPPPPAPRSEPDPEGIPLAGSPARRCFSAAGSPDGAAGGAARRALSERRMKMEAARRKSVEAARRKAREDGWQSLGVPKPTVPPDTPPARPLPQEAGELE